VELLTGERLDSDVRVSIAGALGRLGERSIVPQLTVLLANKQLDWGIRASIAGALGRLGERSIATQLVALLTGGDGIGHGVLRIQGSLVQGSRRTAEWLQHHSNEFAHSSHMTVQSGFSHGSRIANESTGMIGPGHDEVRTGSSVRITHSRNLSEASGWSHDSLSTKGEAVVMAKIRSFRERAWSTTGVLAAPMDPGALNFGVAGLLALAAGVLWYLASAGPGWVARLPRGAV